MSVPEDGPRRPREPRVDPELHPRAPSAVRWIVRTLEEAGFETWAVGGAVRDALLGETHEDWDFATAARPSAVRRLFPRTVPIGIEHGTVGVLSRQGILYEVTTFRRDVETDGRHARVMFADRVEDDLARRDFTINALAWHPLREELRDPFDGVGDLRRGVLRTVGDPEARFREDYLRVLRALRFAGHFGLRVEEGTWRALHRARTELGGLSAERIREELLKILGGSTRPSASMSLYAASGVLEELSPELAGTVGAPRLDAGPGDLWSRGLLATDALPASRPLLRLAALLRETGLVSSEEGGEEDGPGTVWERGALRSAALLERLRFSNAEIRTVASVVEGALRPPPEPEDGPGLRRWLAAAGRDRVRDVLRIRLAVARTEHLRAGEDPGAGLALARGARTELRRGSPLEIRDLALNGRDLKRLGLRPGPHFGEILDRLLEYVLEDPGRNEEEALLRRARALLEEGSVEIAGERDG